MSKRKIKKPNSKTRLSYSSLKHFADSPVDFIKYINKDFEWTDSMILGSAVDCKLLEPEKFKEKFIVIPKIDKRTKAGKEQYLKLQEELENSDLIPINEELKEKAEIMKKQILKNPHAKYLLDHTQEVQKEIKFKTSNGIEIKGILDGCGEIDGKQFIFDLKTTQDGNPINYYRNVIKWKYHLQAWIYNVGILKENIAKNKDVTRPDFYHIVIENNDPYKVSVVKFSKEVMQTGAKLFKKILKDYSYCLENNLWHQGYEFNNVNIQEIDFPEWYLNQINN